MIESRVIIEEGNRYTIFIQNSAMNGYGNIFIGIGQFKPTVTDAQQNDPSYHNGTVKWLLKPMTVNYKIRVFTTGCFFYHKKDKEWTSNGLIVS